MPVIVFLLFFVVSKRLFRRMIKYKVIFFVLWAWFLSPIPSVFAREYKFRHVEPRDGLSNSLVNVVFKDSRGYMWFGTSSGLNRYDGYDVKVYSEGEESLSSLPSGYINDIKEDPEGNLWIKTSNGYVIYRPLQDLFDRDIRQHVFNLGLEQEPDLVHFDEYQNYWFYVSGVGVFWYNVKQKTLYPFLQTDQPSDLSSGEITCLLSCKEGALVVYEDGMLACIDGESRRIAWKSDYLRQSIRPKSGKLSAYVDKNENIWVYGTSGAWIYNKTQDAWVSLPAMLVDQWKNAALPGMTDAIVGVVQDANGCFWIATRHYGLLVCNPQTRQVEVVLADKTNPYALRHNSLKSIYITPEKDIIWVGTAKSGVALYCESAFKFDVFTSEAVTALASSAEGLVYMGLSQGGVKKADPRTGEMTSLVVSGVDKWDVDTEISSVYPVRNGNLWVGTNDGRIVHLSAGKSNVYQSVSGSGGKVSLGSPISSFLQDGQDNVWIATLGDGLQYLDVRNGKMRIYNKDKNNLPSDKITSLCFTKDGKLLMGTYGGVALLDIQKHTVKTYTGSVRGNIPFLGQYVVQVLEDCRGLWWIATRDGINIYDSEHDHLEILGVQDGLAPGMIYGITECNPQSLWVTTSHGISNIMVSKSEQGGRLDYRVYNFTEQDGLQGYEWGQRAITATSQGYVAVGGIHGVNVFHPDGLVYNKLPARVLFSDFTLNGENIVVGETYDDEIILSEALADGGVVQLNQGKDMITISWGADDYSRPEKTRFRFKLEGFQQDWMTCRPMQHHATFTNLPVGKYVFMVKAVNSDGYNSDEVARLTISVKGGFWTSLSGWLVGILSVVLLLCVVVWLMRRYKKRQKGVADDAQDSLGEMLETKEEENMSQDASLSLGADDAEGNIQGEIIVPDMPPMLVLVDEKAEFLSYLNDGLKDVYRLRLTSNAEEAWERILLGHPDAVLLSVASVSSEVFGLCQRIKSDVRTASIRVLMLPDRESGISLMVSGADAILAKPFTPDTLKKHVQALLSSENMVAGMENRLEFQSSAAVESHEAETVEPLLVVNARRYVEENISRTDLTVEEMAREMQMSRAHFYKKLYAATGKNPIDFIRSIRIKRAAELLKNPAYNVSEVAYQVGFNNPRYLTKYFSEQYGMTPMDYHRQYKKY